MYRQKGHEYYRKWVVVANPEDPARESGKSAVRACVWRGVVPVFHSTRSAIRYNVIDWIVRSVIRYNAIDLIVRSVHP